MRNYIQFEIKSFLTRRNIFVVVLCILFVFCDYHMQRMNFENSIENEIDKLMTAEREEQQHIDILSYNLKQHQSKKEQKELEFWNKLIVYTQSLKEAYKAKNDPKILKIRLTRNILILDGVNKQYLNRYTASFIPDKKSLKEKIEIDTLNLRNNRYDGVYELKPTSVQILKGVCSVNVLTYIILILIVGINSNIWSKEFSQDRCYQLVFSYSLKRKTIVIIRNMVNIVFSMLVVLLILIVISMMGFFQYGSGINQYIFSEGIIQNIASVLLKDLVVFFLGLFLFIQLIQILSLIVKDEMIASLLFLVVLLVSVYFIKGWNPFSFLNSYNINHPILKCLMLSILNLFLLFFSGAYIENIDFE